MPDTLIYNPGLIHLGYATLYDTKQMHGQELDHGWKMDAVERNFPTGKVSIQGQTFADNSVLLSGATWVERRQELASALGLDIANPDEAQKLSAFMSAFNQAVLAIVPQEIKALLGEEARASWTDSRFDVSYKEGKFFVAVTQVANLYKNEDDQVAAFEREAVAKRQPGELYKQPLGNRSVHYTLQLDSEKHAFSLVGDISFDKGFSKAIEDKKAIDPSVPLHDRVAWFNSRQISHALDHKSHDTFTQSYHSFLTGLPETLKIPKNNEQLLKAGLESAVIEHAYQFQLTMQDKAEFFEAMMLPRFDVSLDDYINEYQRQCGALDDININAIKSEITNAMIKLMMLYSECCDSNEISYEGISEKFTAVAQEYQKMPYAKMLLPLSESMGKSIIAERIEQAAFPQLAHTMTKQSVSSHDSGMSDDSVSVHGWRGGASRSEPGGKTRPSDDDDNNINKTFHDWPNM